MHTHVTRGDVFLADLDPVCGCEQGGTRPVLVVQNNTGNSRSATTIVAAIAQRKPSQPTHVAIYDSPELKPDSVVLLEQLRTIDEKRLAKKLCTLGIKRMHLVDIALVASLGIRLAPRDPMLMTLCRTCAQSFRDADGFTLRQIDPHQSTKELCTVCNMHTGYDFEVTRL